MTDLESIIARLEKGETGREIDGTIYCIFNPGWVYDSRGYVAASEKWLRSEFLTNKRRLAPAYTTSLDAALTLVPPLWYAQFECGPKDPRARVCFFSGGPTDWHVARADTPALALCIAALKARASE